MDATRPKRLTNDVLLVLCAINLIDCINATILVPYVDAFVSTLLHKERGDPSVAIWASVLVGSYSVCEVFFSGMWGILADRFGRRPILLIGLAGSAFAPLLLGLAESIPVALAARVLDGFFCGNVGVTRTYLGELVDETNEASAFGTLSITFSVGIFIGPLLGGLLSEPAVWLPSVFAGTWFDRWPYLLPNACYSCFALASLAVGCCSLKEVRRAPSKTSPRASSASWSRRLVALVVAQALWSGYTSARLQAFVLITSLPRSMGGMEFEPRAFGLFQIGASAVIFLTQLFVFKQLFARCGPKWTFALGVLWTVLLTLPFPAFALVQDGFWRYVPFGLWQALSQLGFGCAFPTITILVNRECSDHNRGAINGWANSANALLRGLFPFIVGWLVQVGCDAEPGLPGGRYLAFYVNLLAAAGALWLGVLGATAAPSKSGMLSDSAERSLDTFDGDGASKS